MNRLRRAIAIAGGSWLAISSSRAATACAATSELMHCDAYWGLALGVERMLSLPSQLRFIEDVAVVYVGGFAIGELPTDRVLLANHLRVVSAQVGPGGQVRAMVGWDG